MSFNEAARQRALAKIATLRSDPAYNGYLAWGISSKILAQQLEQRLEGTQKSWPHQRQTSLCGPAAFMFCLIQDRPDMYVDLVVNLWLGQPASLGGGPSGSPTSLRPVNPNRQVQANTPAAVTGRREDINAVDWISLASLRNDSPSLFANYDHPSDKVAGITRPQYLRGWFEAAGATCLRDNTSEILPTSDWKELIELSAYTDGWVLMLVAGALFSGAQGFTNKSHWVVVNSTITIDGRDWTSYRTDKAKLLEGRDREDIGIQADFFTWGQTGWQLQSVRQNRPDLAYFLRCFHGGMAFSRIP